MSGRSQTDTAGRRYSDGPFRMGLVLDLETVSYLLREGRVPERCEILDVYRCCALKRNCSDALPLLLRDQADTLPDTSCHSCVTTLSAEHKDNGGQEGFTFERPCDV